MKQQVSLQVVPTKHAAWQELHERCLARFGLHRAGSKCTSGCQCCCHPVAVDYATEKHVTQYQGLPLGTVCQTQLVATDAAHAQLVRYGFWYADMSCNFACGWVQQVQ